jgi:hypothetical protein
VLLVCKRSSEACGYGAGMDASTTPGEQPELAVVTTHTVATAVTTLGRVDHHIETPHSPAPLLTSLSGRRAEPASAGSRPPGFFGRYTKVNRCLTEGRRALAQRLAEIERGIGCAKLAPLLGALADGDASADQLELLRPHLNTCLDCRARLKSMRAPSEARLPARPDLNRRAPPARSSTREGRVCVTPAVPLLHSSS